MTTLRSYSGATGSSTTEPSGATNGDRLCIHAVSVTGATITLPSGWTSLANATYNGNTIAWGTIVRGSSAPSYTCSGANVVDAFCFVGNDFTPAAVIQAFAGGSSGGLGSSGSSGYYIGTIASKTSSGTATITSSQLSTNFFNTITTSAGAAEVGGSVSAEALTWSATVALNAGAQSLMGASPAFSTTVTKDVASAAAISTPVNLTVSSSAAISTVRTASVTTAGALSQTHSLSITSSAAIGGAVQVTSAAAISTTHSATTTSTAAISTTHSISVTTTAAASTTGSTTVATAAATLIPKIVRLPAGHVVTIRGL